MSQAGQHKKKQSKQTDEPVIPKIKWNKDSIELNGKIHRLPITKECMLKEYSDVFKGIGNTTWRPIPHQTEGNSTGWFSTPRSVPVAMQDAYKAELERTNQRRYNH